MTTRIQTAPAPAPVPPAAAVWECCAVLVHYRCPADLVRCRESLRVHAPGLPLVVVENGSGDGSREVLPAAFAGDPDVLLVELEANGGFGAGCNRGIDEALVCFPGLRHVLVLNPDTEVRAGFLDALLDTATLHPDAGIVGGRVRAEDGSVWFENGRVNGWTLARSHVRAPVGRTAFPTEFVTGALMLVDAGLLRDGLRFDERYFLYAEDLDLCAEVRARGRSLWVTTACEIVHRGAGSWGGEPPVLGELRAGQLRHMTRGKVLFARKRLPWWQRLGFLAVAAVVKPLAGLVVARSARFLAAYVRGFREGLRMPLDAPPAGRRPQASTPADAPLAAVVLTWNAREETLGCLAELQPALGPGDRIIVVDNASTDGTAEAVRERFPGVDYVRLGTNRGFAGGTNAGLRRALEGGAQWLLLWNNDAGVPAGAVDALRRHAAAHPGLAAVQPALVDARDPDRIDSCGHELGRLPSVRDLGRGLPVSRLPEHAVPVAGACAAAVLVRAEAVRQAGLLDEELFVIFEDVDWMLRLRRHGWGVHLLPSVRVPHRRGVSAGRDDRVDRARRRQWVQRNAVALALRWWPFRALLVAAPVLAWRALQALWLGRHPGALPCLPLWRRSLHQRSATRPPRP